MKQPIICTSERLRKDTATASVARELIEALKELDVEHRELKNTNDIWCRDYMPLLILNNGSYACFTYRPDYLYDKKRYRKYITDQRSASRDLNLYMPCDMNIVFDGGNFVRCGRKVIMTDKILMENPQYPIDEIFTNLRYAVGGEIVLIPWDMGEPYGHADAMVSSLCEGRILLNNYGQLLRGKDKAFRTRLLKILEPHFEVIELSYDCKPDPLSWCYINYLRLPHALLLPCLSEHADCDNDRAAIETFGTLFPELNIVPIYALPLIKSGGGLHCITWEYFEQEGDAPNLV